MRASVRATAAVSVSVAAVIAHVTGLVGPYRTLISSSRPAAVTRSPVGPVVRSQYVSASATADRSSENSARRSE
ncbi:MAG: hypothetical protein QOE13_3482 [Gaiellaceae bacterium]|jgi:hypothetical protein|nr:hypothetical protein [Gaiellaceae bacterium]